MFDDEEEITFRGPKRKARENEKWKRFTSSTGENILYLEKIRPSIRDVESILSSPFLDDVEKRMKLTEIGASSTQERQARMNLRLRRGSRRY